MTYLRSGVLLAAHPEPAIAAAYPPLQEAWLVSKGKTKQMDAVKIEEHMFII